MTLFDFCLKRELHVNSSIFAQFLKSEKKFVDEKRRTDVHKPATPIFLNPITTLVARSAFATEREGTMHKWKF